MALARGLGNAFHRSRPRRPRRRARTEMIRDLLALVRISRDKLFLIFLILAMPWAWAFFWVPWWVNVICVAMVPVAAMLLVFHVLPPPPAPRRAQGDPRRVPRAQIRQMRTTSLGVHTLLRRWSHVSEQHRCSCKR